MMDEQVSSLDLASVTDEEAENFLNWLFGPGREDEMLTEQQCTTCGRRQWQPSGKEEDACPTCGGQCAVTGRYQQPDMAMSEARVRGNRASSRAINPEEVFTLRIPL